MMFQNKEDIPRAVWGNPNPNAAELGRSVATSTGHRGSRASSSGASPRSARARARARSRHEISHNIFSVGDNNNNPYVTPYHRVGSGTWDMMDRGSFNGPGGPHNRWQVPAQYGGSMGAEHTLRSKVGMGFVPNS